MDARGATGFEASPVTSSGGRNAGNLPETERRAIEGLYREHAAALRRFVRARVRSETDAEDVLQEVFLRICRRGDPASLQSPAAVLFTTGFRLALNVIRRRRDSPIDGRIGVEGVDIEARERSPEMAVIARQELEALDRAFAALPSQCRKVLALRAVEELSYDEMSARLGISISTLEKHVVKGRRLLREHRAAAAAPA